MLNNPRMRSVYLFLLFASSLHTYAWTSDKDDSTVAAAPSLSQSLNNDLDVSEAAEWDATYGSGFTGKFATDSQLPMPPLGNYLTQVPTVCYQHYEIHTPEDLAKLQECTIVTGNIAIVGYPDPIITLNKLEVLSGSLLVSKLEWVVRLEAPKLARITDSLTLSELTSLSFVLLPALRSVKVLNWKVLPILSLVEFTNEVRDMRSITISDTSLAGFSGFVAESLDVLDISNNRYLDNIVSNVEHITQRLHISANSAEVVVDLPYLKTAQNVSIQEVMDIKLNLLEEIRNSASLSNNHFTTLKLPRLESVGGTLSLLKNNRLSEVDFPSLQEIGGGLMLVNNSKVERIDFFPSLAIIGGAIEIAGNIRDTTMNLLKLVKGSSRIRSTLSAFDCKLWARSEMARVIRGGRVLCINSENESIVSKFAPAPNVAAGAKASGVGVDQAMTPLRADTKSDDEHKKTSGALAMTIALAVMLIYGGLMAFVM